MVLRSCGKGKVKLYSHSGKALSKCGPRKQIEKRERQVNYFKHKKGKK